MVLADLEALDESSHIWFLSPKPDLVEYQGNNLATKYVTYNAYLGSNESLSYIAKRDHLSRWSAVFQGFTTTNLQRRPDLKAAYLAIEADRFNNLLGRIKGHAA